MDTTITNEELLLDLRLQLGDSVASVERFHKRKGGSLDTEAPIATVRVTTTTKDAHERASAHQT